MEDQFTRLRVRIGVDPALEHRAHGLGVALFAREQVRLARRHQPLEPREIPGHLDVARVVRVHVGDVAHVAAWPGDARLEVPQPVDARPEIHRLGPEQPHAVGEGVLRGRQDPLFVARAQAPELGRVGPGGVRRVGSRREAGPQRVEVVRLARPQQPAEVEAARAPGGDVALGLDLRLEDRAASDHAWRLAQAATEEPDEPLRARWGRHSPHDSFGSVSGGNATMGRQLLGGKRCQDEPVSSFERGLLSVVIPCYNEISVLPLLEERLLSSLGGIGMPWEVVFVDDGSRDGSYERLVGPGRCRPALQGPAPLAQLRAPGRDRGRALAGAWRGGRDPRCRPAGPARADRHVPRPLARGRPGRVLPAEGAQGGAARSACCTAPSTASCARPPRSRCPSTPATSA